MKNRRLKLVANRRFRNACLFALLWCLPGTVFAWSQQGHRLVCELAEKQLTARGHQFVESITAMGRHLDGETPSFPEACLWPDEARYGNYRGSYEMHFINIPAGADEIDLGRDCAALDCIVAAIQRSLVYLSRPATSEREKARKAAALRFLGHFVGDLHQPLHVSHGEDWGGNRIKVTWFGEATNLHRVWDHHIVNRAGLEKIASLGALVPDPGPTDILSWMHETFILARQKAYKGPDERKIVAGDELGQAYLHHARPVVASQLAKAGVRLGTLLNRLASGRMPPVFMELSPRE